MSTSFECVITNEASSSEWEKYQFGFKAGHSTGLYTSRLSFKTDITTSFDRVNYYVSQKTAAYNLKKLYPVFIIFGTVYTEGPNF